MPKRKDGVRPYAGLVADTMEMPAVTVTETAGQRDMVPRKRRHPIILTVFAILGSFALGLVVRVALSVPKYRAELEPTLPGIHASASPQPVKAGTDIVADLGRKVEVPMMVEQVLPFIPQGGAHKYRVLGGYLLTAQEEPDKRMPVMAVFPAAELSLNVSQGSYVTVSGFVAMANENAQTAATVLSPEQERDLAYIAQRVNFWDRVTILGSHIRPYEH